MNESTFDIFGQPEAPPALLTDDPIRQAQVDQLRQVGRASTLRRSRTPRLCGADGREIAVTNRRRSSVRQRMVPGSHGGTNPGLR